MSHFHRSAAALHSEELEGQLQVNSPYRQFNNLCLTLHIENQHYLIKPVVINSYLKDVSYIETADAADSPSNHKISFQCTFLLFKMCQYTTICFK